MLRKKAVLATILMTCLSFCGKAAWATEWQSLEMQAWLNHDTYLSSLNWRLHPAFISIPTAKKITPNNQCYAPSLEYFLNQKISGKPLKVKLVAPVASRQLHRAAIIKFDKKHDVGEFFLTQGWAKIIPDKSAVPSNYKVAQSDAQAARLGLWGECDNWYKLREQQRLKGKTVYFKPEHRSYLSSGSIGWVKSVLSANKLELENGLKVQLQGLEVPSGDSLLEKCWSDLAIKNLENLTLGKKIILEKDHLQLKPRGNYLQRYVRLPGNRWEPPVLLNQYLIASGWGKLNPKELNLKYVELMEQAVKSFESETAPPAWWAACASNITQNMKSVELKTLNFDPDCPIKGNIAGSKKNPKKTYHTPLSGWYKRIKHEQCFVDETAAEAAGFTKVK